MWSEKLNQNPAEVAHYWRQFGLNRECCIADLKRLMSATMTPCRKGLLVFKDDFPVLFECLHAVFGLMMSNSRLCEQIHGMMRHSLKSSGPGMDQIDATLFYATGTDYVMKRESRDLLSGRQEGQPPKKKLKSLDHNKTKPQIVMLSEQLLEGASKWKGDQNLYCHNQIMKGYQQSNKYNYPVGGFRIRRIFKPSLTPLQIKLVK